MQGGCERVLKRKGLDRREAAQQQTTTALVSLKDRLPYLPACIWKVGGSTGTLALWQADVVSALVVLASRFDTRPSKPRYFHTRQMFAFFLLHSCLIGGRLRFSRARARGVARPWGRRFLSTRTCPRSRAVEWQTCQMRHGPATYPDGMLSGACEILRAM